MTSAGVDSGPILDARRWESLVWVRRVRDRIDREFDRPLDIETLARDAHMSAGHLSREFRAAYGESPYGYLMTRRLERAAGLLREGEVSVTDACLAVGYTSLGTFSSRFRQLFGVTPREYRRAPGDLAALPPCIGRQVGRPVRNEEDSGARPT